MFFDNRNITSTYEKSHQMALNYHLNAKCIIIERFMNTCLNNLT